MARVRILTGVSGEGISYVAGDEVDLPAATAASWCEEGMAELVRQEQVETPERGAETPETTTAAAPRRTGRTRRKEAGSDD